MEPERNLSHSPLFQVMFVLQNAPAEVMAMEGLEFAGIEVENASEKFDLTLNLAETAEGLRGALVYSVDLFNGSTIQRMVWHWERILEGMTSRPEGRLSELELVGPEAKVSTG